MTTKAEIVARLGESAVLLPDLIAAALVANDRAKLRLTLLQEAAAHAADPGRPAPDLSAERRAVGLDEAGFDATIAGARPAGPDRIEIPGAGRLIEGLNADIAAMIAPIAAAEDAAPFAERLKALDGGDLPSGDTVSGAALAAMTSARRGERDSQHLLIMDLHKAINLLADQTAVETVDGARAHRLADAQRQRLQAFMRGLNRTAPLAFGHPGLGTTAVGGPARLTIQNDIGATDAHVIVIHVEGLAADVTYTDVHRRRAKFFIGLFDHLGVTWTPLGERAAQGLSEDAFFLVAGRYEAKDLAGLDAFLERLGSRLVFLIDWNKARKALQGFVGKGPAVDLLSEAAALDLGHRAFLELGGVELVLDAVRRVAAARAPYGARLDEILGEREAYDFLGDVLRIASEGLAAGRSARLVRDEIQAGLAQRLQSAEGVVLTAALRHLGLSRMLAGEIRDALAGGRLAPADARAALAVRATRLEKKGDRLTIEAREATGRLAEANPNLRLVVDHAEQALDALDEVAFLFSLAPAEDDGLAAPLEALAEVAVESAAQMVRACEAASRTPSGARQDANEALQAIDAVCAAERAADDAERRMIAALMAAPPSDPRAPVVGLELAHTLERATDDLAHASLALRDYLLGELAL
ncbi:MAG: hypothetical protein P4L73_14135 [Caulobacteraceae bacterium]|nr:hypothetical protein [Caulobacteraceae bacterium]